MWNLKIVLLGKAWQLFFNFVIELRGAQSFVLMFHLRLKEKKEYQYTFYTRELWNNLVIILWQFYLFYFIGKKTSFKIYHKFCIIINFVWPRKQSMYRKRLTLNNFATDPPKKVIFLNFFWILTLLNLLA